MTTALIDGDIVAYRVASTVKEHESVDICYYRIDVLMQQILEETEASYFKLFVKGSDNFRYKINPEYKANRDHLIKPYYLEDCHKYLTTNWTGILSNGYETDDYLGFSQTHDTIIASIDKDLLQIPGDHWNFVQKVFKSVTKQDGLRHFYKQMLIGDVSDNLVGVYNIGPKKAAKLIDYLDDEQAMFDTVYNLYDNPKRFVMNAGCFWIMQEKGITWANRQDLILPNECQQEVEAQLKFMKSLNQTTLTELGTIQNETCGIPASGTGQETTATNNAA